MCKKYACDWWTLEITLFGLEWSILKHVWLFYYKIRLQTTQDGKFVKDFWWGKKTQNGDWNSRNFRFICLFCFVFKWVLIHRLLKFFFFLFFYKWPWSLFGSKFEHTTKRSLAALRNKLLPFAEFVRQCKSKGWAKSDWECLSLVSNYSISFF